METNSQIIVKAMCFFIKDQKILLSKGFDEIKKEYFYRPLGGHIDFLETSEIGIRREIREELSSEIQNLKLVKVLENMFTYQGIKNHEIVFIYSGDLARKDLYDMDAIKITEPTHEFYAYWVPLEDAFNGEIPLYPEFNYKELVEDYV